MTAELITAITGAIVGIGGLIFGFIKWHTVCKKEKTEKIISDKIDKAIMPLAKNQQNMMIQIDLIKGQQEEDERCRIRTEIMDAVTEIENGMCLSDVMFQHLETEYQRYHALNGNSYIDGQMEFIREYFKKKKCNK